RGRESRQDRYPPDTSAAARAARPEASLLERLLMRAIVSIVLAVISCAAAADDGLELLVDARLIASDGRTSYLDGGLGKLRFDEDHDGLQVGRVRAAWSQDFGERWKVH